MVECAARNVGANLAVVGSLVHFVESFTDKQGQWLSFRVEQIRDFFQNRLESKNQIDVQSTNNLN